MGIWLNWAYVPSIHAWVYLDKHDRPRPTSPGEESAPSPFQTATASVTSVHCNNSRLQWEHWILEMPDKRTANYMSTTSQMYECNLKKKHLIVHKFHPTLGWVAFEITRIHLLIVKRILLLCPLLHWINLKSHFYSVYLYWFEFVLHVVLYEALCVASLLKGAIQKNVCARVCVCRYMQYVPSYGL